MPGRLVKAIGSFTELPDPEKPFFLSHGQNGCMNGIPSAKILLLCYNVVLSVYLKHVLKDYPRINVFHFDGWAKHNGIPSRKKDPSTGKLEDDASLGNRLLEHLQHHAGDSRKYDAILVDEAQDFPPIWFSCILEALTDPLDGDLLIVCDGNQGIRLIDAVSWKSLGIKAVGQDYSLRHLISTGITGIPGRSFGLLHISPRKM